MKRVTALIALAVVVAASSIAQADPLPGRDLLKFSQKPMVNTVIPDITGVVNTYGGHDELSTAYGFTSNPAIPPQDYNGRFMADDFADKLSSPVVHVKWWGSYRGDLINPNMPVNKFLISFESDIPQGPASNFSRPGQPLLNQVVTKGALAPGSGTYTEKLIRGPDPVVGESLYEYNAELHLGKDFPEIKDTVYWLKIVALVDVPAGITFPANQPPAAVTQWGWHNRDYTIQNPLASNNIPGPPFPPGERIDGVIGANIPIYHFQDDAVEGDVRIIPDPQMGLVMPLVFQPFQNMSPTHYLDFADGPGPIPGAVGGIGQFSKDLAFELYTIPEPTSVGLMGLALVALAIRRRRASVA
jgi:hypothetical protein